jgi:hypothetical protein
MRARRLLRIKADTTVEKRAAPSRMSSVMGKISIFEPSFGAILVPGYGPLLVIWNSPAALRKIPPISLYQAKLAPG